MSELVKSSSTEALANDHALARQLQDTLDQEVIDLSDEESVNS